MIAFLVGMYLLKGLPYHIRGVISMLTCAFATNLYELVWSVMSFASGVTMVNPTLIGMYILVTIGLGASMLIANNYFKFIKINKFFFTCLFVYIVSFLALYISGFFYDVGMFMLYNGPDPHNWLWAVTKGLGFFTWVCMLGKVSKCNIGEVG